MSDQDEDLNSPEFTAHCAECGEPIPGDDTGNTPYCPQCWVRFTPEGFYGMEDWSDRVR